LLAIKNIFLLIGLVAGLSIASPANAAYGHGCQAQGGCCIVGSCADTSVISPIYMMFAAVGAGAVAMFGFYNRPEQRKKLGTIFNIFY
jgi:hypothetical protein